jgi:predicted RecA/RadA family phage recombinase
MVQARFYHGDPLMADYTPSAAVSTGDVIIVGDMPLVAHLDMIANRKEALAAGGGVYQVVADGAIAAGKRVYWDNTADKVTLTAAGNTSFGWTLTAASNDGDLVYVLHLPMADTAIQSVAATVATLVDNSGGAAADGTIGAVTTFTPSVAWNGSSVFPSAADATAIAAAITALMAAVKELSTKQNAVLTSLKGAGLMAP